MDTAWHLKHSPPPPVRTAQTTSALWNLPNHFLLCNRDILTNVESPHSHSFINLSKNYSSYIKYSLGRGDFIYACANWEWNRRVLTMNRVLLSFLFNFFFFFFLLFLIFLQWFHTKHPHLFSRYQTSLRVSVTLLFGDSLPGPKRTATFWLGSRILVSRLKYEKYRRTVCYANARFLVGMQQSQRVSRVTPKTLQHL